MALTYEREKFVLNAWRFTNSVHLIPTIIISWEGIAWHGKWISISLVWLVFEAAIDIRYSNENSEGND